MASYEKINTVRTLDDAKQLLDELIKDLSDDLTNLGALQTRVNESFQRLALFKKVLAQFRDKS